MSSISFNKMIVKKNYDQGFNQEPFSDAATVGCSAVPILLAGLQQALAYTLLFPSKSSVQLGDLVFEPTLHFHPRIATAARSRGPVDPLIFVGGPFLLLPAPSTTRYRRLLPLLSLLGAASILAWSPFVSAYVPSCVNFVMVPIIVLPSHMIYFYAYFDGSDVVAMFMIT